MGLFSNLYCLIFLCLFNLDFVSEIDDTLPGENEKPFHIPNQFLSPKCEDIPCPTSLYPAFQDHVNLNMKPRNPKLHVLTMKVYLKHLALLELNVSDNIIMDKNRTKRLDLKMEVVLFYSNVQILATPFF